MNERIRELAEQAAKKHGHTIRFTEEITETLDSFAELIVRECAKVSERTGALNGADYEGEMIADAIKEHFGVEE